MTLVKDISPTGIKAMRERISAEARAAHTMNRIAVQKRQWAIEAHSHGFEHLGDKLFHDMRIYRYKRDDHMDAARRCKWELEQL